MGYTYIKHVTAWASGASHLYRLLQLLFGLFSTEPAQSGGEAKHLPSGLFQQPRMVIECGYSGDIISCNILIYIIILW